MSWTVENPNFDGVAHRIGQDLQEGPVDTDRETLLADKAKDLRYVIVFNFHENNLTSLLLL
jgi:hypothetical protein